MTDAGPVAEAAATGDHRRILEALRDRLAAELDDDDTPPQSVAGLAKQLAAVSSDLDHLTPPEVSNLDEIANARARRRSGKPDTPVRKPAARSGNKRRAGSDRAGA